MFTKCSRVLSHVLPDDFFLVLMWTRASLPQCVLGWKIVNKGRELLLGAPSGYQIVATRAPRQFLRAGAA